MLPFRDWGGSLTRRPSSIVRSQSKTRRAAGTEGQRQTAGLHLIFWSVVEHAAPCVEVRTAGFVFLQASVLARARMGQQKQQRKSHTARADAFGSGMGIIIKSFCKSCESVLISTEYTDGLPDGPELPGEATLIGLVEKQYLSGRLDDFVRLTNRNSALVIHSRFIERGHKRGRRRRLSARRLSLR